MTPNPAAFDILSLEEFTKAKPFWDGPATERATRLLINAKPVPGNRLDAFLFFAAWELL